MNGTASTFGTAAEGFGLRLSLAEKAIRQFKQGLQCLAKIDAEMQIEALPGKMELRTINTARSAFFKVTYFPHFFDTYTLGPGIPVANTAVALKHLLATFRTKVIARYDIELDMDGTVLSARVESDTGLVKQYRINCINTDPLSLPVDRDTIPTTMVAQVSDLSRLLSTFQASHDDEITLIAASPTQQGLGAGFKECVLQSFVDPLKSGAGGTLHTAVAVDAKSVFLQYTHRAQETVDVTFNIKDFKAMVSWCELMHTNIMIRIASAGLPLLAEPYFNGVDSPPYGAELFLSTLQESQQAATHLMQPDEVAAAGAADQQQQAGQQRAQQQQQGINGAGAGQGPAGEEDGFAADDMEDRGMHERALLRQAGLEGSDDEAQHQGTTNQGLPAAPQQQHTGPSHQQHLQPHHQQQLPYQQQQGHPGQCPSGAGRGPATVPGPYIPVDDPEHLPFARSPARLATDDNQGWGAGAGSGAPTGGQQATSPRRNKNIFLAAAGLDDPPAGGALAGHPQPASLGTEPAVRSSIGAQQAMGSRGLPSLHGSGQYADAPAGTSGGTGVMASALGGMSNLNVSSTAQPYHLSSGAGAGGLAAGGRGLLGSGNLGSGAAAGAGTGAGFLQYRGGTAAPPAYDPRASALPPMPQVSLYGAGINTGAGGVHQQQQQPVAAQQAGRPSFAFYNPPAPSGRPSVGDNPFHVGATGQGQWVGQGQGQAPVAGNQQGGGAGAAAEDDDWEVLPATPDDAYAERP